MITKNMGEKEKKKIINLALSGCNQSMLDKILSLIFQENKEQKQTRKRTVTLHGEKYPNLKEAFRAHIGREPSNNEYRLLHYYFRKKGMNLDVLLPKRKNKNNNKGKIKSDSLHSLQ